MTPAPPRATFDIAVVGLGIVAGHHLTVETQEVLRRSRQVFTLDSGYRNDAYLRALGPDVVNLNAIYRDGQPRRSIYQEIAGAVVAAAVQAPPVSFATYGHPKIFCYPATLIQRAARLLDLALLVLPALSALDALLVDLNYDFGTDGLQMYDATDALLRRRPLQPDVPCILWQATWIAEPVYRTGRASGEYFVELENYLREFYPPEHEVITVFAATHPALASIVERHPLRALGAGLADGVQSGTLFIPPVQRRPMADTPLLERLR